MIETEPCPVQADGSAHRCFDCHQPIAVGAPVLDFGRHGYRHHPTCDGASSSVATGGVPDNGDLVAAAMAAGDRAGICDTPFRDLVSEELFKSTGKRLPPEQPQQANGQDNGDKVAAAMGLTLPSANRSQS